MKDFLKFLFIGPLSSNLKLFKTIRSDIVSVQETLDNIASRLSSVSSQLARGLEEVHGKISELEVKVAAGEVADFSAVNAALEVVSNQAHALDNVVPEAVSEVPLEEDDVVVDDVVVDDVPMEDVVTEDVSVDPEAPAENV